MMKAPFLFGESVLIEPHETLIRGEFQIDKGRIVAAPSVLRIRALIETELEKIGSASGG